MSVGSTNPSIVALLQRLQGLRGTRASTSPAENLTVTQKDNIRASFQKVLKLRQSLEKMQVAMERGKTGATDASSSSSLGLSTASTATTLVSSAAANTDSPYSTTSPSWSGSSSSAITLGGSYAGSSDTFTVTVTSGGTIGTNAMVVDVTSTGGFSETINIASGYTAGTAFTLSNNVEIAFGAGTLVTSETAGFTGDGESVTPDASNPFNGSGASDPNLESGQSVTAGSFQINGTTINVNASDSLNDVISTINGSAAGVTATYNASTEQLTFTQNTAGSANTITVGSDTSGFLAAFKLDGATQTLGSDGDDDDVINTVSGLSGISSGTAVINNVSINIDITTDSLRDVIGRINASGAGVTASLNNAGTSFTLAPTSTSTLEVGDGSSGLFTALNVATGEHKSSGSGSYARQAADAFGKSADIINDIYKFDPNNDNSAMKLLRGEIKRYFQQAEDTEDEKFGNKLGFQFNFKKGSKKIIRFSQQDRAAFNVAFQNRFEQLEGFLVKARDSDSEGLLDSLIHRLKTTEKKFRDDYGSIGLTLSVSA